MNRGVLRRHLILVMLVGLCAVLTTASAGGAIATRAGDARKAPRLKDPDATGRRLSEEFVAIVQRGDTDALAKFLDPAFQLQRADGSGATRAEYLAKPAVVGAYALGDTVTGTQHDDVLVVRWSLQSEQTVDGRPYKGDAAPRLSVYHWDGTRWRLAAHANFNTPASS